MYKIGLVSLREYHLTTSTFTTTSWSLFVSGRKLPPFILEPSSPDHIRLIERLTDPKHQDNKTPSEETLTLVSKPTNSPSASPNPPPSPGPVNNCFICVRVHGYITCVPSFCKKDKTHRRRWRVPKRLPKE